jgi:restriction system protein
MEALRGSGGALLQRPWLYPQGDTHGRGRRCGRSAVPARQPAIIVQCKAWSKNVGVKAVRELFGVMAADGIEYGIFATTSDYTKEAYDFAQGRPIELMSGQFMEKVRALTTEQQHWLLERATEGDFTTPTCPNCNVKMTSRESKKGANAGSRFWGCPTYPKCRQTFKID